MMGSLWRASLTLNSNSSQFKISCPLLRNILLTTARVGVTNIPAPPAHDSLNMQWALRHTFLKLNVLNFAASTKTRMYLWSEYIYQGEIFPLLERIISSAHIGHQYRQELPNIFLPRTHFKAMVADDHMHILTAEEWLLVCQKTLVLHLTVVPGSFFRRYAKLCLPCTLK